MDMKLEAIVLPVSEVDRAKAFYEQLGWRLDADFVAGENFRVVQLTPPRLGTSIVFGNGVTTAVPGTVQGLHLAVFDIEAARDQLVDRGVEVGEVFHDSGGVFHHARDEERVAGPDPDVATTARLPRSATRRQRLGAPGDQAAGSRTKQ